MRRMKVGRMAGWLLLAVFGAAIGRLLLHGDLPPLITMTDADPVLMQTGYAKQNAHTIQLALERYAVDNDWQYPASLQLLREQAYLHSLPENPYSRKRQREAMSEVPLGGHAPGSVTYLRHYGEKQDEQRGWYGYTLLVYGDDAARRRKLTWGETDTRRGLNEQQRDSVPWNLVLLSLHQVEGKGDRPYRPLPEPDGS